jgi:hypothetical protein
MLLSSHFCSVISVPMSIALPMSTIMYSCNLIPSKPSERILLPIARRTRAPTRIRRHVSINRTHRIPITALSHPPITQILPLPRMLTPGNHIPRPLGHLPLNERIHAHGACRVGALSSPSVAGGVRRAAVEARVIVVGARGRLTSGHGAGLAAAPAAKAEARRVHATVTGRGCGRDVAVC